MAQVVTVFGSSTIEVDGAQYSEGIVAGRLLAEAGFTVATGGYGGLMEAASKGAAEREGEVIGVTVPSVFADRTGANDFVTREIAAPSLMERVEVLTDLAAGFLVFPGSLGTMTELMAAWNLNYVARFNGGDLKPVVTVGQPWSDLVPTLATVLATDAEMLSTRDSAEEAVQTLIEALG